MRIWKHSPWDALLLGFGVLQLVVMFWQVSAWQGSVVFGVVDFAVLVVMIAYNVIVVSHLFTHAPWFVSPRLNSVVSTLNSVNIGQSVQAYQLTHVRNHHRFNNDSKGTDGSTRDRSSTYRNGKAGEHESMSSYALGGALESLVGRGRELLRGIRLWRVGEDEGRLLSLASRRERRRARELRQIRVDRAAHSIALLVFFLLSWQWALFCYLPAFFVALALVNVQNYYRHYGANPHDRAADSVSHYGRLYNLLTFNDGYHQEHHLSPTAHWSQMPAIRETYRTRLAAQPRIVSPVPAMLGFLDRGRPLLHHDARIGGAS